MTSPGSHLAASELLRHLDPEPQDYGMHPPRSHFRRVIYCRALRKGIRKEKNIVLSQHIEMRLGAGMDGQDGAVVNSGRAPATAGATLGCPYVSPGGACPNLE